MGKVYFALFLAILEKGLLAAGQIIVETAKRTEGDSITLQPAAAWQNIETITWTFGAVNPTTRIASWSDRVKVHVDQFRDRLQLDRHTGSLNVTDLNINDTGIYQLQVMSDNDLSTHRFKLTVYRPVFKPHIRRVNPIYEERTSKVCVLECSVIHGREVTLSVCKGQERVSNTSRPEPNNNLTLSLKVEETDTDEYSCVAENPVTNRSVDLHITELCLHTQDPGTTYRVRLVPLIALLAVTGVFVTLLTLMLWWKRGKKWQVGGQRNEEILTYSSIRIKKPDRKIPAPSEEQSVSYAEVVVKK